MIEENGDIKVLGEADNGRSAVTMAKNLSPDITVMDVSMPNLNGIEATRKIKTLIPDAKVIALSMHADRRFVTGMLGAGASGFIHKSAAFDELVEAIRIVAAGGTYTSRNIADVVMQDYVRRLGTQEPDGGSQITARETEVLQLIAEGKSTKQVAEQLNISANTVETHRHRIMRKLDLHSVAELTKYAVREGLTSVED